VKAKDGDQVVIDFVGRIDGEAFEGGSAEDVPLVLGSGQFIPGFEEQLVGVKPGADVTVKVTFPAEYQAAHLAGKEAEFEVKVKEVKAPVEASVDDELAKRLGVDDLEALKKLIRENLEQQYQPFSRFKLKRALLDELDAKHDFPLPPKMVEAEFNAIWCWRTRRAVSSPRTTPRSRTSSCRPNTARSPSAACAWVWCWPRSAAPTTSR
jgi:trigger factor